MNQPPATESGSAVLMPLIRMALTFVHIGVWAALCLAVFFGLYTVPTLMMAGFFFLYVTIYYLRHRRSQS